MESEPELDSESTFYVMFADFGVNFGDILPPFWHRLFDGILEAVGGRLEGGNGDPRILRTGGVRGGKYDFGGLGGVPP